jgi:CheY-like chemotaxis protein
LIVTLGGVPARPHPDRRRRAGERTLLERLLISGGFADIRGTTDPRAAAALYDEIQPDIVLLDLHMPHVDGFALMDYFQSRLDPRTFCRFSFSPRT